MACALTITSPLPHNTDLNNFKLHVQETAAMIIKDENQSSNIVVRNLFLIMRALLMLLSALLLVIASVTNILYIQVRRGNPDRSISARSGFTNPKFAQFLFLLASSLIDFIAVIFIA